ncbi:MAG: HAD family hydrolase [Sporichthyaceae bacterium]
MRPAAVACDLDGTLLRSDLTISPRTRAALAMVESAGVLLVFVTGRPPRWIHPVAEQTDHRGIAICSNGALRYDMHTETVIGETLIAPEALAKTVALLREQLPGLAFGVDYGEHFVHDAGYPIPEQFQNRPDIRLVDAEELVLTAAAKLLVRHEDLSSDDLLARVRAIVGDLVEPTHSTPTGAGLLEISAAGVSKAAGLAAFLAERGIAAADVVAFGDMPNDLPMLAWAGRPYAVANAHPAVLAAVPHRAPSNDDDGVAQILELLFQAAASEQA